MTILWDSFRIAWIDVCYIRRNIVTVLVTSLVAPLLYLISFGYGFGRGLEVEGFEYISFVIPGVIALTTLTACVSTVATKVFLQRTYYQSFDELFLCSMSPSAIVLGKSYAGVIRGLISCAILYVVGILLSGDMMLTLPTIIMILVSCLTYGLLGVVSGLIANSHLAINMFNSLVVLPMSFLCGTIFSLDSMPAVVQAIIWMLPLTHTTECIRASALGIGFPWVSFAMMVIYCIAFYLISRAILVRGTS